MPEIFRFMGDQMSRSGRGLLGVNTVNNGLMMLALAGVTGKTDDDVVANAAELWLSSFAGKVNEKFLTLIKEIDLVTDDESAKNIISSYIENNKALPFDKPFEGEPSITVLILRSLITRKFFEATKHILSLCKEHTEDIQDADQDGDTLLHIAVRFGYEDKALLATLIELGFSITKPNRAGMYPLKEKVTKLDIETDSPENQLETLSEINDKFKVKTAELRNHLYDTANKCLMIEPEAILLDEIKSGNPDLDFIKWLVEEKNVNIDFVDPIDSDHLTPTMLALKLAFERDSIEKYGVVASYLQTKNPHSKLVNAIGENLFQYSSRLVSQQLVKKIPNRSFMAPEALENKNVKPPQSFLMDCIKEWRSDDESFAGGQLIKFINFLVELGWDSINIEYHEQIRDSLSSLISIAIEKNNKILLDSLFSFFNKNDVYSALVVIVSNEPQLFNRQDSTGPAAVSTLRKLVADTECNISESEDLKKCAANDVIKTALFLRVFSLVRNNNFDYKVIKFIFPLIGPDNMSKLIKFIISNINTDAALIGDKIHFLNALFESESPSLKTETYKFLLEKKFSFDIFNEFLKRGIYPLEYCDGMIESLLKPLVNGFSSLKKSDKAERIKHIGTLYKLITDSAISSGEIESIKSNVASSRSEKLAEIFNVDLVMPEKKPVSQASKASRVVSDKQQATKFPQPTTNVKKRNNMQPSCKANSGKLKPTTVISSGHENGSTGMKRTAPLKNPSKLHTNSSSSKKNQPQQRVTVIPRHNLQGSVAAAAFDGNLADANAFPSLFRSVSTSEGVAKPVDTNDGTSSPVVGPLPDPAKQTADKVYAAALPAASSMLTRCDALIVQGNNDPKIRLELIDGTMVSVHESSWSEEVPKFDVQGIQVGFTFELKIDNTTIKFTVQQQEGGCSLTSDYKGSLTFYYPSPDPSLLILVCCNNKYAGIAKNPKSWKKPLSVDALPFIPASIWMGQPVSRSPASAELPASTHEGVPSP